MTGAPFRLAARIAVVVSLAVPSLTAHAPVFASASSGKVTVTEMAFARSHVNASSGIAVVHLNWTVKDSSALATAIAGDVTIRLAGPQRDTYVGQIFDIPFSLSGFVPGLTSSGTAQDSSYSYAFAVPRYSFASTAHWVVTGLSVHDNQGNGIDLAGSRLHRYSGVLTATELVDSAPPGYDSLQFPIGIGPSRPYVYDGGSGGSSSYSLNSDDAQSGFWKGVLTLAGPGGRTLSASFQYRYSVTQQIAHCGSAIAVSDTRPQCQVAIRVPVGTAAGTWTVSRLQLWDNAGNHATFAHLNVLPVIVTSNAVVQAGGFGATPDPVDNWLLNQTVQISMSVSGARGGVSTIYVDFTDASPCRQESSTPTPGPGGTYSVPVSMFTIARSCAVAGIAVLDGSGDVSVYGTEYGEPDLGLTLTRVPDTTPPVATGASLSPASLRQSPDTQFVDLTVDVDDAVAPVDEISETIFDSSGNIVGGGIGGLPSTVTGPVTTPVPVPAGLSPGTYTVAFQLTDAGGLTSSYGYPNTPPVPGGPLQFTITP